MQVPITDTVEVKIMETIRSKLKDAALVAEKRQLIVKGALSVFKEKGYHKATVRDISRAAKVSMGSLYDCISTKEDVLFMFYKTFMSTFQKELITGTNGIDDPKQKLRVAYRTLLEVNFSLQDEILFGWTEAKNMKASHLREVLNLESGIITYFKEILDELKLRSEAKIEDTNLAANFLVYSGTFGVLRRWALTPAYDEEQVIDFLMETQLREIIK